MNDWLLQIIRCPITGQPLQLAGQALIDQLREKSRDGKLFSHKGIAIGQDFESGLIDQSQAYFLSYPGWHSIALARRSDRSDRSYQVDEPLVREHPANFSRGFSFSRGVIYSHD